MRSGAGVVPAPEPWLWAVLTLACPVCLEALLTSEKDLIKILLAGIA